MLVKIKLTYGFLLLVVGCNRVLSSNLELIPSPIKCHKNKVYDVICDIGSHDGFTWSENRHRQRYKPSNWDDRNGVRYNNEHRSFSDSSAKDSVKYEKRSLSDFNTRGSRVGFMRKVYAIFTAQMICTIAVTVSYIHLFGSALLLLE